MRYRNQKIILLATIGFVLSFSVASAKNFTIFNATNVNLPYFSVNGTSGNVGVGTTTPAAIFEVVAPANTTESARFNSNYNGQGGYISIYDKANLTTRGFLGYGSTLFTGLSDSDFGIRSQAGMAFGDSGSVNMYIKADGNVGIGTTAPGVKLEVNGDIYTSNGYIQTSAGSGTAYSSKLSTVYTYPYIDTFLDSIAGASYEGRLRFRTNSAGGALADKMVIQNNGNVGIGTTVPNDLFSIGNSGAAPAGSAKTGHNFTSTYLATDDYALANYGLVRTLVANATSSLSSAIGLWGGTKNGNIWNGDAGVGNVGIGTASPGAKLQVTAASGAIIPTWFTTNDWVSGTTGSGLNLQFGASSGNTYTEIGAYSTGGGAWNNLILQRGGGNVGIGTTAPIEKLQVNGSMAVTGAATTLLASSARISEEAGSNASFISMGPNGSARGQMSLSIANSDFTGYLTPFRIYDTGVISMNVGNVGVGTTAPNDTLSIGNSGAAPAGSAKTGHNYTMTYLATDTYALVNYGTVNTLIAAATSSMGTGASLWGGTKNGTIYNGDAGVGNVGIGTTNPGYKMDLGTGAVQARVGTALMGDWPAVAGYAFFGNQALTQTSVGNYALLQDASGGTYLNAATGHTILFSIGNTNKGIMDSAGNVGIGTTAPGAKLNVTVARVASTIVPSLKLATTGGYDASGSGTAIDFGINQDSYPAWVTGRIASGYTTGAGWGGSLMFSTNDDSNVLHEQMRITSNGNVGIGTTAPNDVFSIGNSGTAPAGSSKTGHNYTMTYLATDDYALANYGLVRTITVNASNTAAVISGGDLNMGGHNILNVNKLTVNTIDPLYDIKGIKYSTYAGSISGGVKEEVVGKVIINSRSISDNKEYEKVIDFAKETEGSNLWVWRQVIDFTPDNIEVFMTPFGKFANTYYSVEDNKLIFHSDRPVTISYRLIGSRFDWRKWPTRAINQMEQGMKVE